MNMELTYEKNGDCLIPNLIPNEEPEGTLTRYGLMREKFLKEHRRGIYQGMILSGGLKAHCLMVQEQAEQRMDFLTAQMAKAEGVTEELKETDQMKWVGMMNNIRQSAEESVLAELIYV
ncbi:MAG: TnpV protein [Lachnospiraceae bacterium]|nr:TnpV protein [Lachnospiraceae bacterium]